MMIHNEVEKDGEFLYPGLINDYIIIFGAPKYLCNGAIYFELINRSSSD